MVFILEEGDGCSFWQCKWGLLPQKSINCEAYVQTIEYVILKCQYNLLGRTIGLQVSTVFVKLRTEIFNIKIKVCWICCTTVDCNFFVLCRYFLLWRIWIRRSCFTIMKNKLTCPKLMQYVNSITILQAIINCPPHLNFMFVLSARCHIFAVDNNNFLVLLESNKRMSPKFLILSSNCKIFMLIDLSRLVKSESKFIKSSVIRFHLII